MIILHLKNPIDHILIFNFIYFYICVYKKHKFSQKLRKNNKIMPEKIIIFLLYKTSFKTNGEISCNKPFAENIFGIYQIQNKIK